MQHTHTTYPGIDNIEIFEQRWSPDAPPLAVLAIVHGAGEHSGRYQRFAEHFVALGYAVAALDLPGHGRSGGIRGVMSSLDDCMSEIQAWHQRTKQAYPDRPIVLLGHSMGGLLATNYLIRYPNSVRACVLSGPALKSDVQPGWFALQLIRLLSRIAPKLGVLKLDASAISRNPAEVQAYEEDPLVYRGKLSARMLDVMFIAMREATSRWQEIQLPLLILHGSADQLTSPEGSRDLFKHAASTDKRLEIYPGLFHEIFNEDERDTVFGHVDQWCRERIS